MAALIAVALLLVAVLASPRLRQQLVTPATRSLTADAILASAAAKIREANVVVEFPNAAGR